MTHVRAHARLLPGTEPRLHLQDGPIDLIVTASGAEHAVQTAFAAAAARFATILDELCAELALLRRPLGGSPWPHGAVAQRMRGATEALAGTGFLTPMAAVAGAVADTILSVMVNAAPLSRAAVNNGGDIALHLTQGEQWRLGLVDDPAHPALFGRLVLTAQHKVGGIATSGWRGRSFSRGIADAVTVLAVDAAAADAAATIIANAVDLPDHPGIVRVPATSLQPDSDLGALLVTRDVPKLAHPDIDTALAGGLARAEMLRQAGLIVAAALHLQGRTQATGLPGALTHG